MTEKKGEYKKESSMFDLMLNPHLMTKEQIDFVNKINKAKYDYLISLGIKPKQSDFWGS